MASRNRQILAFAIRLVIGVGIMLLILQSVSLDDWVTLEDGRELRVTNWAEIQDDPRLEDPARAGELELELEGETAPVPLERVARDEEGNLRIKVGLTTAARSAEPRWIWLSLLCFAPVPLLQSVRFRWIVQGQDIDLSLWEAMKLVYAGNFLNFVALGSTGGDVFKAYYVSTHTDRKTEAVTTVLLDRAVGMVGLVLITLLLMLARSDDPKIATWLPWVALLNAGLLVGVFVAFSRRARNLLRVDAWLPRLPFGDQLVRVDAAVHRMRHDVPRVLAALSISILLQAMALCAFMLAGFGLGMSGGLAAVPDYFVYLSLTMLVAAIPVTYQGLGTVDATLQYFFQGVYGNFSQVLFIGIAVRLVQLFWSLPGGLVPLTGAHRPSAEKLAQLEARPDKGDVPQS